jgi:NAD(P)-dependent dehydrogenase (short-subunit alcohol dehydrogenase family)
MVALRGRIRWTVGYNRLPRPLTSPAAPLTSPAAPLTSPAAPLTSPAAFAEEGVYLVTGGLGGIGLAMAVRLARDHRARLVLLGRTGLPPREQWPELLGRETLDTDLRRRIEGVQAILEHGGKVEVVTGDVSVVPEVEAAVARAFDRFGRLDGVLHVAGVPGIGLMQFKSRADAEKVLAPKVTGTLAIERAIQGRGVGSLVLFSSVTSMTGGGPGQVDYCAANAFLDAYARDASAREVANRVVAVSWGEWTWDAWSVGLDGYDPVMQEFFRTSRARFGVDFEEGWEAVRGALASGEPHVVVSTQDFATLARNSGLLTVDVLRQVSESSATVRHPRPDLSVPFVEPRSGTEAAIAALWATALGLDRVGVLDRFFELGGNSLIGVDLVLRIRRELGLAQLPPHVLYEAPTVEALAVYIAGGGGTDADEEDARRRSRAARRRASFDRVKGRAGA